MRHRVTISQWVEEIQKEVALTGTLWYGNLGIGAYEFWGARGNHIQMGYELEDVSWDKEAFTPKEVNAIDSFTDSNEDKLCELFISQHEKEAAKWKD